MAVAEVRHPEVVRAFVSEGILIHPCEEHLQSGEKSLVLDVSLSD